MHVPILHSLISIKESSEQSHKALCRKKGTNLFVTRAAYRDAATSGCGYRYSDSGRQEAEVCVWIENMFD